MAKLLKTDILAVGFEIDFSGIRDVILRENCAFENKIAKWTTLSGVWYAPHVQHMSDSIKGYDFMYRWFYKKLTTESCNVFFYVDKLWITDNFRVIAGEVNCCGDKIYSIFYN